MNDDARPTMSATRPILMSGPLVRAALEGRKTQTRRLSSRWRRVESGEQLWVKETWLTHVSTEGVKPSELPPDTPILYAADHAELPVDHFRRPSLFMMRHFSRLLLRVESIRHERLHAISEADARLEGFGCRDEFRDTWLKLNGADSWAENPEVAVITYTTLAQSVADGLQSR